MDEIFVYFFWLTGAVAAAWILFMVLSKLPQGPVLYFSRSNGQSFAFPMIPTIVFAIICLGVLWFFLR